MKPLHPGMAALLRAGAHLASPGGRRGSLLVLMYHRVLAEPDPLLPDEPDAARFAAQLDLVSALCNIMSLVEAARRLADQSLPPRAAAITFDDGYANNVDVAGPALVSRGLTATFFVAPGFSEGGCMFNDLVIEAIRVAPAVLDLSDLGFGVLQLSDVGARHKAILDILARLKYLESDLRFESSQLIAERAGLRSPPQPMMTEAQLRKLADLGMDVGAHSMTHPILAKTSAEKARAEIVGSKRRLEQILGRDVLSFAYPNGRPGKDYGAEHVSMVREAGFKVAVSTAHRAAARDADPLQLPRVAPWDRTAVGYGLRLVRYYAH